MGRIAALTILALLLAACGAEAPPRAQSGAAPAVDLTGFWRNRR